ncbi:MAG: cupredoxin domain-containing protein [Patescibacteria group bacterium]|jgi:cytochrome c oxidase subunit 2
MNKIFFLLLLALALSGCAQSTTPAPTAILPDAPAVNAVDNPVVPAVTSESQVQEFAIIAKQWVFEPAVITVKRGQTVKLKVTSVDVEHSLSLPAFKVNLDLLPGKTVTAEFVADQVGEFNFRCAVLCGEGHKTMTGRLVVTE